MSFDNIIGRRFQFIRQENSFAVVRELNSETWFHADGSVTLIREQEPDHESQQPKGLNDVNS